MKRSWLSRLLLWGLPTLAAVAACDRQEWTIDESAGFPGASSFGGSSVAFGGSGSFAGSAVSGGGVAPEPCRLDSIVDTAAIFSQQTLSNQFPARAELFTLVSDQEASALRDGAGLISSLPSSADPPELVGILQQVLPVATPSRAVLLQYLIEHFGRVRSTWPNPWALRLVDHPASEHLNPVRIVLRDDAWVVRIIDSLLVVLDSKNGTVPIEQALAQPERIGAVFYTSPQSLTGGGACATGHRSFVIGSEAMIKEWSLGTDEILARLDADLALLDRLFQVARPCPNADATPFNTATACQAWTNNNIFSEYTAYQWSLAWPVELYRPTGQNLANLSMALQGDRFEPDPYIVGQGLGGAGDGGAGGAGLADAGQGGVGLGSAASGGI